MATEAANKPNRQQPETLRGELSLGLTVDDIQKSIAWYRDVAGFYVEETWEHEGKVMGASLLAGSARLVMSQDDWGKGRDRKKGEGMRLHIATAQDVDEVAARIKANGGKLDSEPADMPWGEGIRAFSVTDPNGFKITIASEGH